MSTIPAALVTGASRGLGRGIALALAESGFHVGIHYAGNREAAETTAADCRRATHGDQMFPLLVGDISEARDRQLIFDTFLESTGRLDALINNAGITSPDRAKDITEATEEGFDRVVGVNLKGPHFMSQLAARYWLAHPGDCAIPGGYKLVFISSISAEAVSINRSDYCMTKVALGMTSQLWSIRLAEIGAQVVEFRPGIMETDMTAGVREKYDSLIAEGLVPHRRWGRARDLGKTVGSFVSGHWPFCTGEVVYCDGGLHIRQL